MVKIPTTDIKINSLGEFNRPVEIKTVDGKRHAKIKFHDVEDWYPVDLLTVVAMSNCPLGLKHLANMRWVKQPEGTRYMLPGGYFIWFEKDAPEISPGVRVVPCYWLSAVNEDGSVYLRSINGEWSEASINECAYYSVTVNHPTGKSVTTPLHRLVALAWVKNSDPSVKNLVDHDDGNKLNPKSSNLVWVTYAENNAKAFKQGLRSQNMELYVKDVETSDVKEFHAFAEAARFMQCTPSAITQHLMHGNGKLFRSKWLLSNTKSFPKEIVKPGQHSRITVICPNGKKLPCSSLRDAGKYLPTGFVDGTSFEGLRKAFSKHGYILERKVLRAQKRKYVILNVDTGTERVAFSVNEIVKLTGNYYATVTSLINKGPGYSARGFAVKLDDGKPWPTSFKSFSNAAKDIVACDSEGKETIFKSIRAAEKVTGVNQKAISRSLKGIPINLGYNFTYR